MDEVWSFVGSKDNPVWLWFALERTTRRILAWVIGDRSQETAFELWDALPLTFEQRLRATFCTDEREAYDQPLLGTHRRIGKAFTTHVERFNTTLRQRVGRLVRKTLSFSKPLPCFHATLTLFIHSYNASR